MGLGLKWQVQNISTFKYLNENGYAYLQAEKNGLLSENNRKLRERFGARKNLKRPVAKNPLFWTNESKWPFI